MRNNFNTSERIFLHSNAAIDINNEKYYPIYKLYINNSQDNIITVDDNGKINSDKVTKYYKGKCNPDQQWLKVCFKLRDKTARGQEGVAVTNDTLFLTKNGYKRAENLQNNDLIATGEPILTNNQLQILLGTIMGDSHLPKKYHSLEFSHCIKQKEWISYKAKSFGVEIKERINKKSNKINYCASIPSNREFFNYRQQFYIPTRQAPKHLIKDLDWLGLCCLFLDNGYSKFKRFGGYSQCSIAIHSLNEESRENLFDILRNKFKFKYFKFRNGSIHFPKADASYLYENICKYVPDSMQYKIHKDYRQKFDPTTYDLDQTKITSWYNVDVYKYETKKVSNCGFSIKLEKGQNIATMGGVIKSVNN